MASFFKIEYEKLPNQAQTWFNQLPPTTKATIYLILAVILTAIILYAVFIFIDNYLEKRKKLFRIKVGLDQFNNFDLVTYTPKIKSFLSELHDLIQNQVLSYEIFSDGDNPEFYITLSDETTLNAVCNYLTKIKGYSISNITSDKDPIDTYFRNTKKILAKRLYLRKNYYPLKSEVKSMTEDLIEVAGKYDKPTGIMFLLRPVDKTPAIESQISKINGRMNPSKSGNYSKQKQIELLEEKLQLPMFLTEIYVFSESNMAVRSLTSIIKGMPGKNKFGSRNFGFGKSTIRKLKFRYVTKENLFTPIFRTFFGSYLNVNELVTFFLPPQKTHVHKQNGEFVVKASK
jgi:hypothetical protein